jgi:hypothetical protein
MAEWMAYLSIDPIDTLKDDYRFAYLASLLTNLVIRTMGKAGAKLTSTKDFLIEWDIEDEKNKKQQSPEDMKSILLGIANSVNKKLDAQERMKRTTPPKVKAR